MERWYCLSIAATCFLLSPPANAAPQMSAYETWSLYCAAATAVATCVATLVVIVAAKYTYLQLKEVSKARQLDSASAFLRHIDSPEARNARRLVYSPNACTKLAEAVGTRTARPTREALDQKLAQMSNGTVNFESFHSYLASLEHLSMLVLNNLAPDLIVQMYFSRMAPHHWRTLQPFIRFMREFYGSDDFLQHFEMLNRVFGEPGTDVNWQRVQKKRADTLKRRRSIREGTTDYQVVLLPDAKSEAALIKLSSAIHNAVGSRIILDRRRSRPHVTLYLAAFPTGALPAIKEKLAGVSRSHFSLTLSVSKPVERHDGLVMLHCSEGGNIRQLHADVVDALNPLRLGAIRSAVWDKSVPEFSPQQLDLLNEVGYPYALELWSPHLTIADVAPEQFEEALRLVAGIKFEVRFQNISLGLSDSRGRFRKYLCSWPLQETQAATKV